MPKNTSISLGDHFADFVDTQIASGRYASASEVLRAGLRLLEEREAKLSKLRELIREGDEAGPPIPLDREAFFESVRAGPQSKARNG